MIIYSQLTANECKAHISNAKRQINAAKQNSLFSDKDKQTLIECYKKQIDKLNKCLETL